MLKKVALTNTTTGRSFSTIVDADTDDKALMGSGKAANETAEVSSITGLDERIQRITSPKANLSDRAAFFNGLAKCLTRNIGIIKSIQLQAGRVRSPRYRGIIANVCHDLSAGEKFSDAMAKHTDAFPPEVTALLKAGEEAGQLPQVCERIANNQQKAARIFKKLKSGMIYPVIVLVLSVGVIITMSFTLVPAMVKLYGSLNTELPTATKVLMLVSDILMKRPYLVAVPIFGLFMLFKNWGKIASTRVMQKLFLKLPVVSKIVSKSAAAVSFRCLAMLIDANVRLSSALAITAESAKHYYYREFFTRVRGHVNEGRSMAESFLMESHWLGDDGRLICGLMEIAGETGAGTEMLNEIAEDYEEELDTIANQIDKILEPITIVMLGAMVGFLIYAIYAPVFSLGDAILPKKGQA